MTVVPVVSIDMDGSCLHQALSEWAPLSQCTIPCGPAPLDSVRSVLSSAGGRVGVALKGVLRPSPCVLRSGLKTRWAPCVVPKEAWATCGDG